MAEIEIKVLLRICRDTGAVDVLVGPDGGQSEGVCRKKLRQNNVSVGLDATGKPVYIRIDNAQDSDPIFTEISNQLVHRTSFGPSLAQLERMLVVCSQRMADIVPNHVNDYKNNLAFKPSNVDEFNWKLESTSTCHREFQHA